MRSRIVSMAVLAATLALAMFGIPLAVGLAQFAVAEERASLQRLADFTARSVEPEMAHGEVPTGFSRTPEAVTIGLYDDDRRLILGQGPTETDDSVERALGRGADAGDREQMVIAAPVSDTHDTVGVVRVARSVDSIYDGLAPVWLGMFGLAVVVLAAVWGVARKQARRLAEPVEGLAVAASRLGDGDFSVRSTATGVAEIDRVGEALNSTAQRLDELLARERAFSAEASHQLRTPLAGLRLRLEAALDQPDTARGDALVGGLASVDRLEQTIEELLALAREQRHDRPPHATDLLELLDEALPEWNARLVAEGRSVRVIAEHEALRTTASPASVRQVLGVLVDNAVVHGRGAVTVALRDIDDAVALDVSDEGAGIPSDRMPDRSSTVDPTESLRRGHGIGLPLARRLVEAEGGRLLVQPARPTVSLLLPVAPRPVEATRV